MKIWIDDIRTPPPNFIWFKDSNSAIEFIKTNLNDIEFISFDHDLGGDDIAYKIALYIEESCFNGAKCPDFAIHSANPVGRQNILNAMNNAKKFANN